MVSVGTRLRSIETTAVAYFYFEEGAAFLLTRGSQRLAIDHSLDRLVPLLAPRQFFRVNRQYVTSLGAIEVVHNHSASWR